ncbi:MAG: DUF6242 domain-containing protein [Bacteroides sp.]|nr:DUF6242 domain-containing protein [Roseburia sp.]MCM1347333.1 DUF6242 domain-containing protein [Bacteroides sp.]MCM1421813.1 DUF6242 domain-containing protein [Bacteroides sp.]
MKNIFYFLATLLLAVCAFSSCIKSDDIATAPECYISSFSVADIKSAVTTKNSSGEDTIVYRTIGGNSVYFNIDQVRNTIISVDSLPVWTDLSRVVPTVNSYGYVYYKHETDSLFMPLLSGSDSIDFTSPLDFLVIGTDGFSTKQYSVKINKSETEADSLVWKKIEGSDLQVAGAHKLLYFDNRLYVFTSDGTYATVTSSPLLSEGRSWSVPAEIVCPGNGSIEYNSVTVFHDRLYALGTDRKIYMSTSESKGTTWEKASEKEVASLLGADKYCLYAYDGIAIMATDDMMQWKESGAVNLNMLPQTCISTVAYDTRTNTTLQNVVMAGLNGNDSQHAAVWYKISSSDPNSNQKWDYINVTEENEYGCPKLEGLCILRYKDMLLAIGGRNMADDSATAYECIYRSNDNGITWKKVTSKIMLPENVIGKDVATSIATDGTNIWLVRDGGEIWQGRINNTAE